LSWAEAADWGSVEAQGLGWAAVGGCLAGRSSHCRDIRSYTCRSTALFLAGKAAVGKVAVWKRAVEVEEWAVSSQAGQAGQPAAVAWAAAESG